MPPLLGSRDGERSGLWATGKKRRLLWVAGMEHMSQLFKCRHELKLSAGKTAAKRGNSVPGLVFVPFLPRFQRVRSWNQICLRFDRQFKFELNRLVLVLDILQKGLLSCVMMGWDTLLAAWSCLSTYPTATTYISTSSSYSIQNPNPYLYQNPLKLNISDTIFDGIWQWWWWWWWWWWHKFPM